MDKRKALFSGRTMVVVVVLAAVVLAAVGCWVAQQTYGLGITGMNNSNSWGLYIMAFMFFVGLSAGGLIVASSAHVFGIESFKRVSVPAVITSIVCICCAGAFVLIDLGGVARVWRMFVGLNFVSPLAWDMIVITCYLVINVLDLVWLVRGDEHKVAVLSRVALPVAILFISATNPSEFAASLNRIGVSYRVGYSVSIALRYIPDIQRDYHSISQAQQARGVELGKKEKLLARLKNSVNILMPLIISSLSRIDTISNAMELRGFGKDKRRRTWYVQRPFRRNDWLAIALGALLLAMSLTMALCNGSRFYNPFH